MAKVPNKNACKIIEKNNVTTLPLEKIIDYVQMLVFEASGVPGLEIGVVDGKQSVLIACGSSSKEDGDILTGKTVWPIGSVSKVFTTTILATMVQKKQIGLIDPVNQYAPKDISVPDYQGTPITLLSLATQSAGFPRQLPTISDNDDYQINIPYQAKDFYQWLNTYQLPTVPGAHYQYSNIGYGLLGHILAQKVGVNYDKLLQQYITKPLAMSDTTVSPNLEQKKREPKSYWMNGDWIKKDWVFKFEQPSGGIYSTANDMFKFIQYQLNLLPEQDSNAVNTIAHASYIYQDQFENPADFNHSAMSLGWDVDMAHNGLPTILVKSGWVDGFNCYAMLAPGKQIGLFSFTNQPYLKIDYDLKLMIAMVLAQH